jgi:hypothetical protein
MQEEFRNANLEKAMSARKIHPIIAGSCFALFTAYSLAQAPAPGATDTPATSTMRLTEQTPAASTPAPGKMHHAKQHKAMHAARASESNVGTEESQYRMALRHCVLGEPARRDQCLDDAISRYGRS